MPEAPFPKFRPQPLRPHKGDTASKRRLDGAAAPPARAAIPPTSGGVEGGPGRSAASPPPAAPYVDLQVTTNYTFLTGASHPEEYVQQAAAYSGHAIGIADLHTLAGVVRAHVAAKEVGVQLVVGARVEPRGWSEGSEEGADEPAPVRAPLSLLLYPTDLPSYSRLSRLLTLGKRRAPKGECHLVLHDVLEHQAGLQCIVVPPRMGFQGDAPPDERFVEVLRGLAGVFDDDRLSLAVSRPYGPDDGLRARMLEDLARHTGVPLVAVNDVLYHHAERRALQDVLTCIRLGCTLDEAGLALDPSAERHIKPPHEMARLFADRPQVLARSVQIARRCAGFSMDLIRYQYPAEVVPPGRTPMAHLEDLTWRGAAQRYAACRAAGAHAPAPVFLPPSAAACGEGAPPDLSAVPAGVQERLRHELVLIEELGYAHYFLTVHDIVREARERGILCQGRGAAANSAVCYCLGVTSVDPDRIDVLFERFVSKERQEPPDIDIDFEHERREEVIQYLYAKYGRDRAALCAEVITYRGRSAVRDVGKALGLSLDAVDAVAKNIDWWEPGVPQERRLRELGLDPHDPTIARLLALVGQVLGFPRHLSQHVGGFVITQAPLHDLVPIENAAMADRTVIEWDKDDIDAMGMIKVDVLGLGMLTAISKALAMVNAERPRGHAAPLDLATIPPEDPAVYDMVCGADTVGVFQIESRAQMSMLPRLKPRCFYDLVIEVAIVRPGPIQGDMVHPYLRRRNGQEPVTYPDEKVRGVLGKTLGVPLFQEQAMKLAIVAAGFTPGEADQLRRAIAAWKTKTNVILTFGEKLVEGMVANGYPREFAERCFAQLRGFSEYGFPESHAASFALLVYASAWLKRHYPAHFAAALINAQPMGFYAPAQLVRDAQAHGVLVRPVDVNASGWDCALEPEGAAAPALRLGLRLVKSMPEADARRIEQARGAGGRFTNLESFWRRTGVKAATLRTLAKADAFASLNLPRQQALWHMAKLKDEELPLFDQAAETSDADAHGAGDAYRLPPIAPSLQTVHDYAATGLSLKAHPVSFARERLAALGARRCAELLDPEASPPGTRLAVAGIVLVRQRPHTARGTMFMTVEDESGIANLIVQPDVYERFRGAARHGVVVLAKGMVQREGKVVHVRVRSLARIDALVAGVGSSSRDFR